MWLCLSVSLQIVALALYRCGIVTLQVMAAGSLSTVCRGTGEWAIRLIVQRHSNKSISRRMEFCVCVCVCSYACLCFSQRTAMAGRGNLKRLEAHAVGHKGD